MLRRLRIENLVLIREAELELAPGLNAITGETGAGKTILAQAFGLLLGAKGDDSYVGAAAEEAYVEAELDLAEELEELAELRPEDEDALLVSRRVFADGRTRAYAWGRAAAREDVAAAVERVVAMSGQFEQRRLAKPSYQLEVLDRFCGEEQLARRAAARTAWRDLLAARRRHDELTANAAFAEARLAELRALVEDTEGLEPGAEEQLRAERERHRHVAELASGAAEAVDALAPDDGEGAAGLVGLAERSVAPLERIAPELQRAGDELRDVELRLRETASDLHAFLASLEAEPRRLEELEAGLDRIAETKRRFRCATYDELLARREEAEAELAALEGGSDPAEVAARELAAAEERVHALALELRAERNAAGAGIRRRGRRRAARGRHGRGRVRLRATGARTSLARPEATRPSSSSARMRGCRSRRSRRPPPAGSSRGSRWPSRPWPAATRSCSTRSTRGSAARRRTPSERCSGGSRSTLRW